MATVSEQMQTAAEAVSFCQTSATAVIVTVWPTAHDYADMARAWLKSAGAKVLFETEVHYIVYNHYFVVTVYDFEVLILVQVYLQPSAAVAVVMALYHGEAWLESNCWCEAITIHVMNC